MYFVTVHGQDLEVTQHHSTHIPCHLLNFDDKDDQEMKSYLGSLARNFWGELMAEGPFKCVVCGSQASGGSNHPFLCQEAILDTYFPVCDRSPCEIRVVQTREDTVHQFLQDAGVGLGTPGSRFKRSCEVCGKTSQIRKCGRCKIIQYCSIQCQKTDWPSHKSDCRGPT